MFQVTAMYEDAEVAYGEGEGYEYAMNEAADNVPSIYPEDDVYLCCTSTVNGLPVEVKTQLSLWRMFA